MKQAAPVVPLEQQGRARDIFQRQKAACLEGPPFTLEERRDTLQKLEKPRY